MCYSKEVSLVVGSVIVSGCSYSWWKYVWNNTKTKIKKTFANKRLISFFKYTTIGYLCIGGHQIMEFFAIYTGNQILYKIGLIISISCIYFLMKGFEVLVKINFGSKIFVFLIALVGLSMFLNDMAFENYHFWVRGNSHIIWASAWMILFIYWNVCIFYVRKISPVHENKRLLFLMPFAVLNISFLLSITYAFLSAFVNKAGIVCSSDIIASFNVLQDSPSVWCVFAGIQTFFIPHLFYKMKKGYVTKIPLPIKKLSKKTSFKLVWISIMIWLILFLILPIVFSVAWKMVAH